MPKTRTLDQVLGGLHGCDIDTKTMLYKTDGCDYVADARAAILSRIREVMPGEIKKSVLEISHYDHGWNAYRYVLDEVLETL